MLNTQRPLLNKWCGLQLNLYNVKPVLLKEHSNTHYLFRHSVCCHSSRKQSSIDSLHRSSYTSPKFFSSERVGAFVKSLNETERQELLVELQKSSNNESTANADSDSITVTRIQLKQLFLFNCVPFIGFGFLDNAIMILAGESIDLTIGVTLGISTMAAAALGNLISDIAGVGLAGYVEVLCSKLGLPVPDLTVQQTELTSSRVSSHLGKAVGIAIGCIIGMFPLVFLSERHDNSGVDESPKCV